MLHIVHTDEKENIFREMSIFRCEESQITAFYSQKIIVFPLYAFKMTGNLYLTKVCYIKKQ